MAGNIAKFKWLIAKLLQWFEQCTPIMELYITQYFWITSNYTTFILMQLSKLSWHSIFTWFEHISHCDNFMTMTRVYFFICPPICLTMTVQDGGTLVLWKLLEQWWAVDRRWCPVLPKAQPTLHCSYFDSGVAFD